MRAVFSPLVRTVCLCLLALGLVSGSAGDSASGDSADLNARGSAGVTLPHRFTPLVPVTPPAIRLASTAAYERTAREAERTAGIESYAVPVASAHSRTVYRVCRVTAYCDRGITASGVPSGVGQCAAPGDIPLGSIVYIRALDRSFVVTDRTHRRFRRSTVDIFIPSKTDCRKWGRRFLECEFTLPTD